MDNLVRRIVKIPSNESSGFNAQNNRIHFNLEDGRVYDLSRSYIQLYSRVDTEEGAVEPNMKGIHNFRIRYEGADEEAFDNADLIKHCHLRSSQKGFLEDVRDINVYNHNMRQYMKTYSDQDGESHLSLGQKYERNGMVSNIFRELHREGSVISEELVAPVKIPLKKLFGLADEQLAEQGAYFNTMKLGQCRVGVEIDFNKVRVHTAEPLPAEGTAGGLHDKLTKCDTVPDANRTQVKITAPLPNDYINPYWVGAKITITGDGGVNHTTTISQITIGADKKVLLFLTDEIPSTSADITNVQVAFVQPKNAVGVIADAFSIETAELVVEEIQNPSPSPSTLVYKTLKTELFSTPIQQYFSRIFYLEPECFNVLCMFPNPLVSAIGLAKETRVENIRMSVDNVDLFGRPMKPHSPLYYDTLMKTFLNSGMEMKNLIERCPDINAQLYINQWGGTSTSKRQFICATPVNETEQQKLFQLEIESGAGHGVERVNVYKQCLKELEM